LPRYFFCGAAQLLLRLWGEEATEVPEPLSADLQGKTGPEAPAHIDPSLLLAITVIGVTVFLLAWKNMKPKKQLVTLQDPETKYPLPLIEKEQISHNTRRFRFGLPSPDHVLGLPVGNYVRLMATIDDALVVRAYTPVSSDNDRGFVDLIIKGLLTAAVSVEGFLCVVSSNRRIFELRAAVNQVVCTIRCDGIYFKNVHPRHPEGGKMTQYLDNMKIGDTILFQGPIGRLFYHEPGKFSIKPNKTSQPEVKSVQHLGMIAGGTGGTVKLLRPGAAGLRGGVNLPDCVPGITPMLQLIRHITRNPSDSTRMSLIFANQTEEDILVRKELEEVARTHPHQFNLWYTLDRPPDGWSYSSGFITADLIKEHLPPPEKSTLILVCGPPPLIHTAAHPSLQKLGYTADMIFTY
ncbi:NADH-cytochrome b5 reductase 2, partial [Galemys pyrenaicus]